jgi:hypothetical protein
MQVPSGTTRPSIARSDSRADVPPSAASRPSFGAYIATDPADLHRWREAAARNNREAYTLLRRDNLGLIRSLSAETAIRFVAWGNLVLASGLRRDVIDAMSLCGQHDLYAFGLTLDGSPKHPLARGKHRIPSDP